MEFDEPGWQLIDDFMQQLAIGRKPQTVRRYARVRHRMTHFLDTADMTFDLGTASATLLELEREFHEQGAFWLIFGPDELVACLPGFISRAWLPDSVAEARMQISVVARLIESLSRDGLIAAPAYAKAKRALVYARHELDARSAGAAPDEHATDIPRRLLRKPTVEW